MMAKLGLMPKRTRLEERSYRNFSLLADVQLWLFTKLIQEALLFLTAPAPINLVNTIFSWNRDDVQGQKYLHHLGLKIFGFLEHFWARFTAASSPDLDSLHLLFQFSPIWRIFLCNFIRHLKLQVFNASKKSFPLCIHLISVFVLLMDLLPYLTVKENLVFCVC